MNDSTPIKRQLICAFDLGGTNLRAAIINDSGTIISRVQHDTPGGAKSPDEIVRALVAAARECESGLNDRGVIQAASVVVPGLVDSSNELVIQVPAIPCLDNFGLKHIL